MQKYFLIGLLPLLFIGSVQAQEGNNDIDSLKRLLHTLKDTARIDCLNELGRQYLRKRNKDSTLYYTNYAYEEAKKIAYLHGVGEVFYRKAWIANFFNHDFLQMEQMANEALTWFDRTPNKKNLHRIYWSLVSAQFALGKVDSALLNNERGYALATKLGDDDAMRDLMEQKTDIYRDWGDYEKLLASQQQIIRLERREDDSQAYTFHELWVMGLMYKLLEDYPAAITFWRQLFEVCLNFKELSAWNQMEYTDLFTLSHQYDSAVYFYNQFDSAKAQPVNLRFFLISKGEYYLQRKEYGKALHNFKKGLVYHQQINAQSQVKRALLGLAKTYAALQQPDSAIRYAREGLAMALQTRSKPAIRDGYEILYSVYDRLQQRDSSHFYYRKYIELKEAVMNNQTRGKLATYSYAHKIELLDKDRQLQQQQLKQTALQKKLLLVSIISILLVSFILLRNILLKRKNERHRRESIEQELQLQKLEAERNKAEYNQHATELEMQVLRAQMNPHFIFNSLNSINSFILDDNRTQASEYLTKFSRLVRLILQNSQSALIPLESELDALQLYLELETLRFGQHFDYKIHVEDDLDISILKVPPLIIQPYAENAIWHGLMHKHEKGHLDIALFEQDESLFCKIKDDGIGRKKATEFKNKSTSSYKPLGMKITANRIAMLHQKKQLDSYITINDLVFPDGTPEGTEVTLQMPLIQ